MSSRQSTGATTKRDEAGNAKLAAQTTDESTMDGTVAVDSRRQKKRELDRRCQRMARERTKARIAYLEGLVEDFRQQDGSGRVASLMKQLDDTVKERDELAKTLKIIESSIKGHKLLTGGAIEMKQEDSGSSQVPAIVLIETGAASQRKDSAAFNTHPMLPLPADPDDEALSSSPDEEVAIDIEPESVPDLSTSDPNNDIVDNPPLYQAFVPFVDEDHDVICPPSKIACDCRRAKSTASFNGAINLWRFANETLAKRETYSDEVLEFEDAFGDDIPVRALIEGWDSVEARLGGGLPPMWQKLRKIDETIFGTCAPTERLAIMRVMHLLLRYHAGPNANRKNALPTWYLRRPSQTLAHSYAIDFFAWPGVRERFVFSQHRYCSNLFWHLFCRSFHLMWPFEFRDTYTYNTVTREYKISADFEERIKDINAWTMARDIFKKWPEFYGDFPTWGHLPMPVSRPGQAANRQHYAGPSRAPMSAAHKGSVVSTPSATVTSRFRQRQHHDSHLFIGHRGAVKETDDESDIREQPTHALPTAPVEVPPTHFSVPSYTDWWQSSVHFSVGPTPVHAGVVSDYKTAMLTVPAASAPQETLSAMSQMYDLPI